MQTLRTILLFVIIVNHQSPIIAQVTPEDSLALIDFYNAADGPNWGTVNWLNPLVPVGEWEGVDLTVQLTNRRVSRIDLFEYEISGTLSPSLANLDSLKIIRFSNSSISGNLDLSQHTAMESLSLLSCPNLSLENLNAATGLFYIFIHDLSLENSMIRLDGLSDLFYLQLSKAGLDSIPDLSEFNLLSSLILYDNSITDLQGLENLTDLRTLNLSNNAITAELDLSNLMQLNNIDLSFNALTEAPAISNMLDQFNLNLNGNRLDFAALETLADALVNVDVFEYGIQDISSELVSDSLSIVGKSYEFSVEEDGLNTQYIWYQNDMIYSHSDDGDMEDETLTIDSLSRHDKGEYYCNIINSSFPDLEYQSNTKTLQLLGEDSLGGLFFYDQLIVEYDSSATQGFRDSLRVEFDASLIDKCQCGEFLELWQFDSLAYHEIELDSLPGFPAYVSDPEEIKQKAKRKTRVNEAGFNYSMNLESVSEDHDLVRSVFLREEVLLSPPSPPNLDNIPTLILIDTGIDSIHNLESTFWTNDEEDDLENCQIGDIHGYNFISKNGDIYEKENGHGTHLTGIITEELGIHDGYDIINARVFGDDGYGELFKAVCAIYYGIENEADVYNLSWGYYGAPVTILENALKRTEGIIISSAGNGIDGIGVDITQEENYHFPASFKLENMISVAALDAYDRTLAPFSNFGDSLVQIAAYGVDIAPSDDYSIKSGTSQAAAAVSAAALCLKMDNPDWSVEEIKHEILNNVNHSNSLDGKVSSSGYLGNCLNGKITHTNNHQSLPEVDFYPNPFSEYIDVAFPEHVAAASFTIYSLDGRVRHRSSEKFLQTRRIVTQDLIAGIYFIEVQVENQYLTKKLVKF